MILGFQSLARDQQTVNNFQIIILLVEQEEATIIEGVPLSRHYISDKDGWHFTQSGKYMVKSCYDVDHHYPDRQDHFNFMVQTQRLFGLIPEKEMSPKAEHYLWQIITWCLHVQKNLKSWSIKCERCAAYEESVNHVLFQCPPTFQVWVFANMDHQF